MPMKRFTKIDSDGFNCGEYDHLVDALPSPMREYYSIEDDDMDVPPKSDLVKFANSVGHRLKTGCALLVFHDGEQPVQLNRNW